MTDLSMAGGDGDVLDQIQRRADKATEGPWEVSTGMADQSIIFMPDGYSFKVNGHPDSKFIAHARTDIPALLAMVREQRAVIERVRELAEELDGESAASDNVAAEVMKAPRTNTVRQELRDHEQHATIATNHAARIRAALTAPDPS